ncbi:MAG: YceI family protein [Gammaproteobacteria bacterium]|nr:YceI family protein [Gammaproteobacteria bacterium]
MRLKTLLTAALVLGVLQAPVQAAEYELDTRHSFIQFRIQHLGFSWMYGRFNDVSGSYSYDPDKPEATQVEVDIDPASIDTNDAERDKHLRSEDFLNVDQYPSAGFKSTGYSGTAEQGTLEGKLTLHGVTKPISIDVKKVGEGEDPWDGYRTGFIGTTTIDRRDFGIDYDVGPASWDIEFELTLEGVRQ